MDKINLTESSLQNNSLNERIFTKNDSLNEITNLINIRNYIATCINSSSINRKSVNYLNEVQASIDKKIVALLEGQDFREYLGVKKDPTPAEQTPLGFKSAIVRRP